MTDVNDHDGNDTDLIICAECLDTFYINQGEECLYSEDWYCNNHHRNHMKEHHYWYYTKVLEIKTQLKEPSKLKANQRIKQFQREGKQILTGVMMVGDEPNRRKPQFNYTEMSHTKFVEHHYPAFLNLKGRDNSQASREAIC